jgi:predicted Zn-dependent protease with MMP-like domain
MSVDGEVEFEQAIEDALDSLPADLRAFMSNVAIVVEEEPPPGSHLLGLYEGFPLTKRSSAYAGVPPDKITIYRQPLERLGRGDSARLRREIRRVVAPRDRPSLRPQRRTSQRDRPLLARRASLSGNTSTCEGGMRS